MPRKRRQFSAEYKLEAVRLFKQRAEAGASLVTVSKELGIGAGVLRRWEEELSKRAASTKGRDVFPGNGKLTSQDEELRRLKRELAVVREERDFLKKATAFFAKESR